MNTENNAKSTFTIDFNYPILKVDKTVMTAIEVSHAIKRLDVDIVLVKGSPEHEYIAMLDDLKMSGIMVAPFD